MKVKPKVFCIGLGRTGTTTLGKCMETLGFRHRGWRGPELGLLAKIDLGRVFSVVDQFDSFDDYPFPFIYRQIATAYPDAKFILTRRKSSDAWVESVIRESYRKSFIERDIIWYDGDLIDVDRRSLLSKRYNKHIEDVREFFSGKNNFLEICWEEGDGWAKICQFLDCAPVETVLPHANRGVTIEKRKLLDHLLKIRAYRRIELLAKESDDEMLHKYLGDQLVSRITASNNKLKHTSKRYKLLNLPNLWRDLFKR